MATIISRTFRSNPYRNAEQTWLAIVELLSQGKSSDAKNELLSISGIASSIIADQCPKDFPITAVCDGPRTRIYCIYDDKAIEGDDANENNLNYDALQGAWSISLPCMKDDLSWVQKALSNITKKVSARDTSITATDGTFMTESSSISLVINQKDFLDL